MKIAPINNIGQPKFRARLPKTEINTVIDSALIHDKSAGIPKLYTLLECLDKMPGKNAELKSWSRNSQSDLMGFFSRISDSTCQLRIDNNLAAEGSNVFDVLYNAITSSKTKDGKKISMPKSVFDIMWWENRDKTVQDLQRFFRD